MGSSIKKKNNKNSSLKIFICFGTRPEAIKMAPIIFELKKRKVDVIICVTAQHREMLDQVLEFFEIKPHYDLNIMSKGQSLSSLSAKILDEIDPILEKENPDIVLVQGDTTTAAMVALAAFYKKIRIGHVEAGLRTYKPLAPFPEEINRQIIARMVDLHFAPTPGAAKNLLSEGISEDKIFLTSNTVVDALLWGIEKIKNVTSNSEINKLKEIFDPSKRFILVTGHRRENFGAGLREICEALTEISYLPNVELIYPVHLNPSVKDVVYELLKGRKNIHLIDPLPYPAMLWLMQQCTLIISDSGGIQEEAPTLQKPVIVTREVSERMEGVEAGFSFLVGTDKNRIIDKATALLKHFPDYSNRTNPYGDGKASVNIINILLSKIN